MKAKLISESLHNFEKKSNPLNSLNVGKKALITNWLDEMHVPNYTINDDYTIDIHNNTSVDLDNKNLKELPYFIQFNHVNGYFEIGNNKLTSLRGCPKTVTGYFSCEGNQLTSLEGCPTKVDGEFWCNDNKIEFSIYDVKKYCKTISDYRIIT